MIRPNLRWLGGLTVAATVFPTGVRAQTSAVSFRETVKAVGIVDVVQETVATNVDKSSGQAAPRTTGGGGLTRDSKIALGAAIGGGIGAVVGEHWFGRGLDMPHGPDMLLGAGMGAGVGAIIAAAVTEKKSNPSTRTSSVTMIPIFSPSRKSLLMRLALR
jgi:hypothetical protein